MNWILSKISVLAAFDCNWYHRYLYNQKCRQRHNILLCTGQSCFHITEAGSNPTLHMLFKQNHSWIYFQDCFYIEYCAQGICLCTWAWGFFTSNCCPIPFMKNKFQKVNADSSCLYLINSGNVKQRWHTSCLCSLPSEKHLRRSTGVLRHCISFCSVFLFCSMCKTGKSRTHHFATFPFVFKEKWA